MVEGHRSTGMPWSLAARDFARMIGSVTLSLKRTRESRLGFGLRQSPWPRSAQSGETRRKRSKRCPSKQTGAAARRCSTMFCQDASMRCCSLGVNKLNRSGPCRSAFTDGRSPTTGNRNHSRGSTWNRPTRVEQYLSCTMTDMMKASNPKNSKSSFESR